MNGSGLERVLKKISLFTDAVNIGTIFRVDDKMINRQAAVGGMRIGK
jgi:hypothetical protein